MLSSEQKIYLTGPLRDELVQCKKKHQMSKRYFGDGFNDYGLAFCLDNDNSIEENAVRLNLKRGISGLRTSNTRTN